MQNDARTGETQTHGRYHGEYVQLNPNEPRGIQALLDEKGGRTRQPIGVARGLPENGGILFRDTQRPSFGRGRPETAPRDPEVHASTRSQIKGRARTRQA